MTATARMPALTQANHPSVADNQTKPNQTKPKSIRRRINPPKHPRRLTRPRRIKQRVLRLIINIVTEADPPQPMLSERLTIVQRELPEILRTIRIERLDRPVPKVPDQQIIAQRAEVRGCLRESPRRIQHATHAGELLDEVAAE